jgi:SAM-dependent methyltransferase
MDSAKLPNPTDVAMPHQTDDQAHAWSASAADYGTEFLDPFRDSIVNPLLGFLSEIDDDEARSLTVADLGCGTGPLLPHLVGRFGKVIALDFAEDMIAQCRTRLGKAKAAKVRFLNRAMHDLDDLAASLDVAATVNSLVMPDPRVVDMTLRAIFAALKPGGLIMGVVPSVDAIHHHSLMLWDVYLDQGYSLEEAQRLVATHMEHSLYDFAFGKFRFGAINQKFWQPDELAFKLRKAGFGEVRMVRLEYPWDDSLAGYKSLKDHPKTWDWTFEARKPAK